jgi:hypothetical protein
VLLPDVHDGGVNRNRVQSTSVVRCFRKNEKMVSGQTAQRKAISAFVGPREQVSRRSSEIGELKKRWGVLNVAVFRPAPKLEKRIHTIALHLKKPTNDTVAKVADNERKTQGVVIWRFKWMDGMGARPVGTD